jgi:GTPase SAR1 family protein
MTDKDNNLEKIRIGCFGESNVGKTYFSRKYINDPTIKDFGISNQGISISYFKYPI